MVKGPEKPKSAAAGLSASDKKFVEGIRKFYAQGGPKADKFGEFVAESHKLMMLTEAALTRLQKKNKVLYSQIAKWIQFDYQTFLDVIRPGVEKTREETAPEELDAAYVMVEPIHLAMSGLSTNSAFDMRAGLITWLEDKPDGKEFQELLKGYQALFPKLPPGTDIDL